VGCRHRRVLGRAACAAVDEYAIRVERSRDRRRRFTFHQAPATRVSCSPASEPSCAAGSAQALRQGRRRGVRAYLFDCWELNPEHTRHLVPLT